EDQPSQGRLAAAGLADDAHRLARRDLERDLVDRRDVAGAAEPDPDGEALCQVADLEERRRFLGRWRRVGSSEHPYDPLMSIASRIASLSVLNAIEVMKIISPGSATTQGLEQIVGLRALSR